MQLKIYYTHTTKIQEWTYVLQKGSNSITQEKYAYTM